MTPDFLGRGPARGYRPVTGCRDGAAAADRRRTSRCMDALAHILLSLLALLGASPRRRSGGAARRDDRSNPAGVPFAISDDAAQRAFPSELIAAHAVGICGRAHLRRLVGDRDPAPGSRRATRPIPPTTGPASTPTSRARLHSGLAVQLAFWRVPAWANGGLAPNAWPLNPQDLGDFAYAVALRYPQAQLFYDWNEPNTRDVRRAQHDRRPTSRWRAPSTRACTRRTPPRSSPPATSPATATPGATRRRGPRSCTPTACRWISSASTRTRCGARR